ncbi:hypothetical protein [Nonomuraea roseoviolacea]|uniref:Htaa domain protein n=1 Tax=Nonomuraea roseoviolacea subsp. carminata TaxID=160689 RepID=A0ABT1K8G2_9ACTN|nr:hypothetical protein [Nonomuraea roseoviolacea]MCP2350276.1 hypothetical protein [Nonomuraea roseoviolacea subsp. carminata]
MLQRIQTAAVVLAMGAGGLVLAPAASAAAAPAVTKVDVDPGPPIVVSDKAVTATFSFATKDAGSAELQLKPPGVSAGSPITLTSKPFGQWTRWTGSRAFEAKDAGTWNVLAVAHGSGGSGEKSVTGTFEVRKTLDTKIVDFDADPDRVSRGDTIKVSGTLLAGGKGYAGQSVTITFREQGTDAYRHVAKVATGPGGAFGARVRAETTGWWRAEFGGTTEAASSVSDTDRVDVRAGDRDTDIAGFDAAPEPVDKGDTLRFTGALRSDGDGVPGQRVSVLFKAQGSDRWEYVTSDVTGRHGRFLASATATGSGWWRAVFRGARGFDGSSSDADWVRVDRPTPPPAEKAGTRVVAFNAYPEPVKRGKYLKVRGLLQIDDEGTWEGYAGKVALYFKPAHARSWQYVKTTRSGDSGKLWTKVKAWKSGSWKFVYAGDGDTYGDTSRADYVRVVRR